MALIDPRALKALAGLLGDTPIGQYAQGKQQVSQEGLLGAMRSIPVFDAQAGSKEAFDAGLNALNPMGLLGGAFGTIKPVKKSYMIEHRPMTTEGGAARLHNLAPSFGEDIYGPNAIQYFGSGDKREAPIASLLKSLRGKPDAEVTVYRGVPKDSPGQISPGDWVTLDKGVAKDYGEKVLEMKVKAKDVTSWADSLLEFGYYPEK